MSVRVCAVNRSTFPWQLDWKKRASHLLRVSQLMCQLFEFSSGPPHTAAAYWTKVQ